ncbi:hypothetical protein [Agrobacterium rosae]|uniref:hypothetical protein n=1 Tax=Agrobacterium rosae TaxID=1972867 RepID=UPI0020333B41|nr:hypothetical protein [Agrobacterium rosae]
MSTTPNLNLPLPDPTAGVDDEFFRLQQTLILLDTIISALQTVVNGKSPLGHTHTQAQVTGLVTALANKMDASKTFKLIDLIDVLGASNAAAGYLLQKTSNGFGFTSPAAALGNHQHGTADIVGLVDFIQQYITALVNSSPAALDTLSELATAIGNDPNFATTMMNAIAAKLATAGGTMTGPLVLPAGIAGAAPITIPHGVAPTAPVNGSLWTTTAGLLARINGVSRTFYDTTNLVAPSQAEAEAGTATTARAWNALRIWQAIAAYLAANVPPALGTGQTWQTVSRSGGTAYQNTTGKPIGVNVVAVRSVPILFQVSADGTNWVELNRNYTSDGGANGYILVDCVVVPNNHYYRINDSGAVGIQWRELR